MAFINWLLFIDLLLSMNKSKEKAFFRELGSALKRSDKARERERDLVRNMSEKPERLSNFKVGRFSIQQYHLN